MADGTRGTVDELYAGVVRACLAGPEVRTRNSVCRRAVGLRAEFDTFPLVGVRKTAWRSCIREMEWFLSGSNDIADLHPSVRPWWEPWAETAPRDQSRRVEFNYSRQFRGFHGEHDSIDQIAALVDGTRDHPFSRRNVITTWNTADMNNPNCPITNCHGSLIQTSGNPDGTLDLTMVQRSADVVCGLPHNWAQYWAFLLWLAHRTGHKPGRLIWFGVDCHVYAQHDDLARDIVAAAGEAHPTPGLVYASTSDDFRADDFTLAGEYRPVITAKAEMVV